ncbi:MAG: hypothetical protein ACLF0P_10920 [Thermoanaerobaculia bacterium]
MAYRSWCLSRSVAVLVLALTQPGTLAGTGVEGDRPPPGFVRLISIADEGGAVKAWALNAVDWYDDRRIQRLLIRTPGGNHVVLSESEFALSGKTLREILVEETSWWLSVEEQSGITFESVRELGDPGAVARRYMDGEKPRRIAIDASGLTEAAEHSSTTWDERFFDDLFLVLDSQPRREPLVERMEAQTEEALEFIFSWTSCGQCAFPMSGINPVVEILMNLLRDRESGGQKAYLGLSWRLNAESSVRAGEPLNRRARALADEFETVTAEDLLVGLRPDKEK